MKQLLTSRLHLYYSTLMKYDLVDKYQIVLNKTHNIKDTKVSCKFYNSTKSTLNKLILNEVVAQQKLQLTRLKKKTNRYDFNYFIISVRKKHFYVFLEVLTNLISLNVKSNILQQKQNFNYYSILNIVNPTNYFFSYSTLLLNINDLLLNFIFVLNKNMCKNMFKNYLFFPLKI